MMRQDKTKAKMQKARETLKQNLTSIISLAAVLLAAAATIAMPEITRKGVSNGLSICGSIIIPSLFPFMVISSFLVESGGAEILGKVFKYPAKYLFGLSPAGGTVVLMSMVGGYPIGAKMSGQLYKNGSITKKEAKNLILFAMNSGPAFSIAAVGTAILGSRKAGYLLFISTGLAMLLMGIYLNLFKLASRKGKELANKTKRKDNELYSDEQILDAQSPVKQDIFTALTNAVVKATSGIISISAWVIFFSAMTEALNEVLKGKEALQFIKYIAEVTAGTNAAASTGNAALIAFIVAFGGLCVHFQVLSDVLQCGVKFSSFLISRLVHGTIAGIIAKILFTVFPITTAVFGPSQYPKFALYSTSVPASIALLFMCAILILDTSFQNGITVKHKRLKA